VDLTPLGENAVNQDWVAVFSDRFERNYGSDDGIPASGDWTVYVPGPMSRTPADGHRDKAGVVLKWGVVSLKYGPPPVETINPLAGQPWIAGRAAMLARMPEEITLEMLSFLAPQAGGPQEQPPLYCHRDVVPVLRAWLALGAKASPNQHAAALVLADQVADHLPDCAEFVEEPYNYAFENQDAAEKAWPALEQELGGLGIEVGENNHPIGEEYSGSLLKQVAGLTPTGAVEELYRVALLGQDECQWNANDDADCTSFIREGEKFVADYPDDVWTPNVRLMLAEAYSIMASQAEGDNDTSDSEFDEWLKKEDEHLRSWYGVSRNERNRALVWQEIWGIEAGTGPWLMAPGELRN
jgi:hypothetical protein